MFKNKSNDLCNNGLFSAGTMAFMHIQIERLYKAAKELRGIEGQSAVARFLDESPQTVKNWESRGISKTGSVKAQARIGCDANWLLSGAGSMTVDLRSGSVAIGPEAVVIELAATLRALSSEARDRAAFLLQRLANDPDGPWVDWLIELIKAAPDQTTKPTTATIQTLKDLNQLGTPLLHTIKPKSAKTEAK